MARDMTYEEAAALIEKYRGEYGFEIIDPRNTETEMTAEEFSAARLTRCGTAPYAIGGSTVGKVLMDVPYEGEDPYSLWQTMTGRKAPEVITPEKQEVFDYGHRAEPYLFELCKWQLEKVFGPENVRCHAPKFMMGCTKAYPDGSLIWPWACINIDGLAEVCVDGVWKLALIEIKSFNIEKKDGYKLAKDWKSDIVPQSYLDQVTFYMATGNIDLTFVFCGWGFGPENWALVPVERDRAYEEEVMNALQNFVFCLETDTPPDMTDYPYPDNLFKLYMDSIYSKNIEDEEKPPAEAGDEWRDKFQALIDRTKLQDSAEKKTEACAKACAQAVNEFLPLFKDTNSIKYQWGPEETLYLSLVPRRGRGTFDEEGYRKALPLHYDRCCGLRGSKAGKFDKAKCRTKFPEDYKVYFTPGKVIEWQVKLALYNTRTRTYELRGLTAASGFVEYTRMDGAISWLPESERKLLASGT